MIDLNLNFRIREAIETGNFNLNLSEEEVFAQASLETILSFGCYLFDGGKLDEARSCFLRAIKVWPENEELWFFVNKLHIGYPLDERLRLIEKQIETFGETPQLLIAKVQLLSSEHFDQELIPLLDKIALHNRVFSTFTKVEYWVFKGELGYAKNFIEQEFLNKELTPSQYEYLISRIDRDDEKSFSIKL